MSVRKDEEYEYIFIQNYNAQPTSFLPELAGAELILGEMSGEMEPFTTAVLRRKQK